MGNLPPYDASVPTAWYDAFGEKEWTRLTHDCTGELLFHVHMDVLRAHLTGKPDVLELGAGAGFFTKELVQLSGRLIVSDISTTQLDICRSKMTELGLAHLVESFRTLDVTCLDGVADSSFDVVICIGGALNYTFDRAPQAVAELLRVLRPGGTAIVGVISLLNSLIRFLPAVVAEKGKFGIEATAWLMETGIQDAQHYPVPNRHFLKMMRSVDLDSLFAGGGATILETRAAGVYALAGEDALSQARDDSELWNLLLRDELSASKNPRCLDCGANIIYVVRKEPVAT